MRREDLQAKESCIDGASLGSVVGAGAPRAAKKEWLSWVLGEIAMGGRA